MELTPIRVRGKRNGQKRKLLFGSQSLSQGTTKTARFNSIRRNFLKGKNAKPTFSPKLEQLPSEIVQLIFRYCMSINLPIASFTVARQLSDDHVYIRFATDLLYCSGPDTCEECSKDNTEAVFTLTRLLSCRWMTWDIFKAAMREAHSLAKKNQITHKEEDDNIIPSPDFDHPAQQDKLHYLHLRSPVQIPQKLLSEPWTQPKIAFLRYLTFVGAGIDWEHSTAGETATQGLRSAIASRNRFVVACLVSAPVGVSPSASLFRFAVIDNGCDQTVVFHLLAAALRSQVMVRFQPASTGHSATDFNFRDPSIWSWAGRAKAGGNAKGSWLTRALKYAAGAASTATTYDRAAHEDFVRACGRVEDGVEQIEVPLGVVEGEPQT